MIIWVIGNELNFEKNPKVWDAVNDLSKMIHQIDPNHPTTTTLAGFNKETVALVKARAPDLDFICFQMYCDIINLPRYLAEAAWDKPYIVTEWGATGHWECGKTAWGAPIENDSTTKADLYKKRFREGDPVRPEAVPRLLRFLLGPETGTDAHLVWHVPRVRRGNRAGGRDALYLERRAGPRIAALGWREPGWTERRRPRTFGLRPGQTYRAKVQASDPDQDPLTYSWEVMEESTERKIGGDAESSAPKAAGSDRRPRGRVRSR